MASALIAAAFFSGIRIASIFAHSAVLAIAPKFLISVTLSRTMIIGVLPSSYKFGITSSILKKSIGEIKAITP